MEIIHFPACHDDTSSAVVWTVLIFLVSAVALYHLCKKLSFFGDSGSVAISLVVGAILLAGMFYLVFWDPYTGVSIKNTTVQLHYRWPRPLLAIDATTINNVDVDVTHQRYTQTIQWKRRLEITTDDKKRRESVYVCVDRNKVGTDYQSARLAVLNDPVEYAEKAVSWITVMSKLASPESKLIKPNTYARLMVRLMRSEVAAATKKDVTETDRLRAMAKLNELLMATKRGLGDNHFAVGIVYRFIGSAYGHQGNLIQAKLMFDRADDIRRRNSNKDWYAIEQRINPNGLSMFEFEHPEINVRTPNTAVDY